MGDSGERKIQPPEWLDQQFIQDALREGLKDDEFTINKCLVKPATAVGDNYVSQMFRVVLNASSKDVNHENLSLVMKSLPLGDKMEEFVEEGQFFVKETMLLSEDLPRLQKLLDAVGEFPKLYAGVYYKQGPPRDLIMLEDLCVEGYKVANRMVGLDLEHCVVVLESLAVLHAGSIALMKKDPQIYENYASSFWVDGNARVTMKKMLVDGLLVLADEVESWPDTPKRFADKLRKLQDVSIDRTFEAFKLDKNKLHVLLHGDTWTNNMMFKYDSAGKVLGVKFVDFQLASVRSPVLDLIYFIFTSPFETIKVNQLDLLLETYHNKFMETVQKLDIEVEFTFQDLKEDFLQRLFFGLAVCLCTFPVTIAPVKDAVDLNQLLDESGDFQDVEIYRSERYIAAMKLILPYFEANGVI